MNVTCNNKGPGASQPRTEVCRRALSESVTDPGWPPTYTNKLCMRLIITKKESKLHINTDFLKNES